MQPNVQFSAIPMSVTSNSTGVALSLAHSFFAVTTNGDQDRDILTLAAPGTQPMVMIAIHTVGHANDALRVTPAALVGGTNVDFDTPETGEYVVLAYNGTAWAVVVGQGYVIT